LRVPHELRIVSDGQEALDYLYQRGEYASERRAPRPDLILLDLNMPRLNGQKVAEQIHGDPRLRHIPIVVLTTSRRHEDMLRAYGRGVATFITKPLDFEHFIAAVRDLERMIKYVLALKTVRQRVRLSDKQVFRLLRRQQELEEMSDSVFGQQMQQIEEVLSSEAELTPEQAAEAARRQEIVRVAQKILETLPERKARAAGQATPPGRPSPGTGGLIELARALERGGGQPEDPERGQPGRKEIRREA
jgi:CheY-like chemotaxis protein